MHIYLLHPTLLINSTPGGTKKRKLVRHDSEELLQSDTQPMLASPGRKSQRLRERDRRKRQAEEQQHASEEESESDFRQDSIVGGRYDYSIDVPNLPLGGFEPSADALHRTQNNERALSRAHCDAVERHGGFGEEGHEEEDDDEAEVERLAMRTDVVRDSESDFIASDGEVDAKAEAPISCICGATNNAGGFEGDWVQCCSELCNNRMHAICMESIILDEGMRGAQGLDENALMCATRSAEMQKGKRKKETLRRSHKRLLCNACLRLRSEGQCLHSGLKSDPDEGSIFILGSGERSTTQVEHVRHRHHHRHRLQLCSDDDDDDGGGAMAIASSIWEQNGPDVKQAASPRAAMITNVAQPSSSSSLLFSRAAAHVSEALYRAVKAGDKDTARSLLDKGASCDWTCLEERSKSCVHVAAQKGDASMLRLLLPFSHHPTRQDLDNMTPFFYAAVAVTACRSVANMDGEGCMEAEQKPREIKEAAPEVVGTLGPSHDHETEASTVDRAALDCVKILAPYYLSEEMRLVQIIEKKQQHISCRHKLENNEKERVDQMARNGSSRRDLTLHRLAQGKHIDALKAVITSFASLINEVGAGGMTALAYAAAAGSRACMEVLANNGALFDISDERGACVIHHAAASGCLL